MISKQAEEAEQWIWEHRNSPSSGRYQDALRIQSAINSAVAEALLKKPAEPSQPQPQKEGDEKCPKLYNDAQPVAETINYVSLPKSNAAADSPTPSAAAGVREWIIIKRNNPPVGFPVHMVLGPDAENLSVVEKSAYDALLAENQRLKVKIKELRVK